MALNLWSERLELGDAELDREHHLQIALASALTDALERNRPDLAARVAEQLAGFAEVHFRSEELLMEAAPYPGAAAHRAEHRSILVHIQEVKYLLGTAEHDLALPMACDLRNGLASHIASHDREYADHAQLARTRG